MRLIGLGLLGGSGVVINGVIVISKVTIKNHIRGLMTPVITTHGPPSSQTRSIQNPKSQAAEAGDRALGLGLLL